MPFSGIFPSTFLQPVSGSKNSILNWVMKLNLLVFFFFFFFCFWNTLERFFILFTYSSYSLVQILINLHEGKLYVSFYSTFFQNFPKNSKIPRKIQEKWIFQQSLDLNFKHFSFSVYHGATLRSHWTKQTVKKTESLGKNSCRQMCLDKSLHCEHSFFAAQYQPSFWPSTHYQLRASKL